MDRGRVVDRARDAAGVEVVAQRVALGGADDEEVVDVVACRRGCGRQRQRRCRPAPRAAHRRRPRRLSFHSSRWRSLTSRIAACSASSRCVPVASSWWWRTASPWERSSLTRCGELVVVGDERAAVAPAAEVLGRVEAEAAGVAERADAAAAVAGAVGLAGVLDHGDAAAGGRARGSGPCRPVRPKRWTGITRGCAGVSACSTISARDHGGLGVDVDQDRGRADGADRLGGGDEGVGGDDHLVAGADPEAAQGELERRRAGGDADRRAAVSQ